MEVKPGFRQTEVGAIPNDWEVRRLGEGIKLLSGQHVLAQHCNTDGDGVAYITGPADFPNGAIQHSKYTTRPGTFCRSNDILVTVKGSGAGTVVLSNAEYCISRQLMAARVVSWNTQFVYFAVLGDCSLFGAVATGLIPGLSRSDVLGKAIPLPPTEVEQETIAAALSDADALIESLEQLVAKKRSLKQGTMQELLTGRKRLAGFSEKWKVKLLDDLFDFSGGFSASRDQLSLEGIPYLHYGDIHGSSKNHIDVHAEGHDLPKLKVPLSSVSSSALLEDGDVVFVDASEDDEGTSRHVAIINKCGLPYISGLHTIVAKSKTDELEHSYRRFCFQTTELTKQFRFFAVGTKVSGISKKNIARVTISIPSAPSEQRAIAAILSDMDAEITALEVKRAKARQIKQGMMQVLLTGRIRLI